MSTPRTLQSLEAFDQLILQPENAAARYEYIAGEIVEVPSNAFASKIAGIILTFINLYLFYTNDIGHATGEGGGYWVSGERYAPDVAFIPYAVQPKLAKQGYNPNPPTLAVEVISSDRADELHTLRIKITNYLAAGCVVWVVYPEARRIEVHQPGQRVQVFTSGDVLSGDNVLPGFTLAVDDVFDRA